VIICVAQVGSGNCSRGVIVRNKRGMNKLEFHKAIIVVCAVVHTLVLHAQT